MSGAQGGAVRGEGSGRVEWGGEVIHGSIGTRAGRAHPPSSLSRERRQDVHREPPSAQSEERASRPPTRGRAPSARERSRRAAACGSTARLPTRSAPQARRRRAPAMTSQRVCTQHAMTSQRICTQQPSVALEGIRRRRRVRSERATSRLLGLSCLP
jgi:hypothetical protein